MLEETNVNMEYLHQEGNVYVNKSGAADQCRVGDLSSKTTMGAQGLGQETKKQGKWLKPILPTRKQYKYSFTGGLGVKRSQSCYHAAIT